MPILIALPILFLLIFFDLVTVSFARLGLSQNAAVGLLLATLIGSIINIPVSRRRFLLRQPQPFFARFFFYFPPHVVEQVIAVNVGGAIIPIGFSLYLLPRVPFAPTLIAIAVVAVISRLLARPRPGVGILMPAWASPLISAGLALLLARGNAAPVAYIAGALGTLIGADLLNWPSFLKLGAHVISIGGAGVFDGIFLSGIVAALITSL